MLAWQSVRAKPCLLQVRTHGIYHVTILPVTHVCRLCSCYRVNMSVFHLESSCGRYFEVNFKKLCVAKMIELLLKSLFYFISLVHIILTAYQTAVETRTHRTGMRTHTQQHSRLSGMHTLVSARLLYGVFRNRTKTDILTPNLCCTKAPLHRLLQCFSFPNLPNILGNSFTIGTSIAGRLISESIIW